MRVGVVEGGQMATVLAVEEKDFTLHMELVHRLKRGAHEDLRDPVAVNISALYQRIPEPRVRVGHRVIQGKEEFAVDTAESESRPLREVSADVLVGRAD